MLQISEMTSGHWADVSRIYLEGILTGQATFQTESPAWEAWDHGHTPDCRLIGAEGDDILGWAALTPISGRCVYAGVAEVSVYISEMARGQGVGTALLKALIDASEASGYWTLQASIFPENRASIRLHQTAGFRIAGHRERIGQMNGVWRDTLILERRSKIIGIN